MSNAIRHWLGASRFYGCCGGRGICSDCSDVQIFKFTAIRQMNPSSALSRMPIVLPFFVVYTLSVCLFRTDVAAAAAACVRAVHEFVYLPDMCARRAGIEMWWNSAKRNNFHAPVAVAATAADRNNAIRLMYMCSTFIKRDSYFAAPSYVCCMR